MTKTRKFPIFFLHLCSRICQKKKTYSGTKVVEKLLRMPN